MPKRKTEPLLPHIGDDWLFASTEFQYTLTKPASRTSPIDRTIKEFERHLSAHKWHFPQIFHRPDVLYNITPLMAAALYGNTDIISALLKKGASTNLL